VSTPKCARPGGTWKLGVRVSKSTLLSCTVACTAAVTVVLPKLSTTSRGFARRHPRTITGSSSARTSVNGTTETLPSGTVTTSGASTGLTRTPYGCGPAAGSGPRCGANVSRTVPVVPGYSRSVAGSAVHHRAGSPTTSTWYSSTMSLVFLIRSDTSASPPASTVTESGSSATQVLTLRR
jgi:hypothetical protein